MRSQLFAACAGAATARMCKRKFHASLPSATASLLKHLFAEHFFVPFRAIKIKTGEVSARKMKLEADAESLNDHYCKIVLIQLLHQLGGQTDAG
jgi:hypothetical protein